MNKPWIAILIFWYVVACQKEEELEKNQSLSDVSHTTVAVVQSAPVFRGDLIERVTARGIAHAGKSLSIRPRISGILAAVPVHEGERVSKGQTLLQLETENYKIALQEARAVYLQASIEYGKKQGERKSSLLRISCSYESNLLNVEHAKCQLEKVTREFSNGTASEEDFIRASAEYEAARLFADPNKEPLIAYQSGLSRSYYQLLKAQGDFDNCTIHAPFSGIIGGLQAQEGNPASPAEECLKLVDFSYAILYAGILETETSVIQPGCTARICFSAFPDHDFRGRVITVSPLINQRTRTCNIEIKIENPEQRLKDGMFATAFIDAHIHKNLLLAPKAALLQRDSRTLVFVVRHHLAKWCYVEIGRENDEYIEIAHSNPVLEEGDHVLTDGHFTLVNDAPIEVKR